MALSLCPALPPGSSALCGASVRCAEESARQASQSTQSSSASPQAAGVFLPRRQPCGVQCRLDGFNPGHFDCCSADPQEMPASRCADWGRRSPPPLSVLPAPFSSLSLAVEGPGTGRIRTKQLCLWGVHWQPLLRHSPSLRVVLRFFSVSQSLEMREGGRWWLVTAGLIQSPLVRELALRELPTLCLFSSSPSASPALFHLSWVPENSVVCFLSPFVCSLQADRVSLQRLLGFLPGDPGLIIIQFSNISF